MVTAGALAREAGLSVQAVRNYEEWGILPPVLRTEGGHRRFGLQHESALRAFQALVAGIGHARARDVLVCANADDVAGVLALLDDAHQQAARDRATLETVAAALADVAAMPPSSITGAMSVTELGRRLHLSPATLRAWERAGVLAPARDRNGHRRYGPDDVRDAELAHLLRRGRRPLAEVALVLAEVRRAGGSDALAERVDAWRDAALRRGLALLRGEALLWAHLELVAERRDGPDATTAAPEDGRRG